MPTSPQTHRHHYYSFGSSIYTRSYSAGSGFRFGFGGHENDNEIKSNYNHLSFGDYGYDSRIGKRWTIEPKYVLLSSVSPYCIVLNCPIQITDANGQFPILINGRVSKNSERASRTYWDKSIRETIKKQTGYYHSQFMYVDGDKGFLPSTRFNAGVSQGKADAALVYSKLKESARDGQITEQIQVISHSRGTAMANGYMQGLTEEIIKMAQKDKIGFAYGKENIVEYSVNIAPHQSDGINFPANGTKNINISHIGDPLSGNDATGNVINVQSIPEVESFDQHANKIYNTELEFTLKILEHNKDKSKLFEEIKNGYEQYDNNRTNGDNSTVTKVSN